MSSSAKLNPVARISTYCATIALPARWGRAQEVPSEDPFLTSEYGSYIISATQQPGDDPRYLAAASTMKHFAMYDFEGIAPWGLDQYPKMTAGKYATPNTASCDGTTQSPTDGHAWAMDSCSRMNIDAYLLRTMFMNIARVVTISLPGIVTDFENDANMTSGNFTLRLRGVGIHRRATLLLTT